MFGRSKSSVHKKDSSSTKKRVKFDTVRASVDLLSTSTNLSYNNNTQRLLAIKDKSSVTSVPRKGERIPALLVDVEKSNIFKVVICLDDTELTVRVSIKDIFCPKTHIGLLEKEASQCITKHIETLLQMFQIVDVILHDVDSKGVYEGHIYIVNSDVSINTILVNNGLAKLTNEVWTKVELEKIKAKEIIDF